MSKYLNDKTFFETPLIQKKFEAEKFIEDYGVDGENTFSKEKKRKYGYKRIGNKYQIKGPLRLFCKDCPDTEKCEGSAWKTCETRMYLLTTINQYLAKENEGLKKDVANYKEILGEE